MDDEAEKECFPSKGLRTEMLKIIILVHLSHSPEYPYALMKVMQKKKVWILRGLGKSDFYNAMNSLEKHGFIKGRAVMKGAKIQKHFILTDKGKKTAAMSRKVMIRSFKTLRNMIKE
jgi:DNA-binding PadR family transcriptional regulator